MLERAKEVSDRKKEAAAISKLCCFASCSRLSHARSLPRAEVGHLRLPLRHDVACLALRFDRFACSAARQTVPVPRDLFAELQEKGWHFPENGQHVVPS